MALSTPSYGQAGSYTAANDRTLNKANAVTAGVRRITGANAGDLAVAGQVAGTVTVAAGDGWIADSAGTGFYYVNNSSVATSSAFATNGTGALRYDPVYLLVVDSGVAAPTLAVTIATGSNVQPTFPALSLPLAVVSVPIGFTSGNSLTTATITDKRTKAQLWDFTVAGTANVATPLSGSVVFDTSVAPYGKLKVYDTNGAWNTLAATVSGGLTNADMATGYTLAYQSATTPASPIDGLLWYNSTADILSIYNGSAWQQIANGGTANTFGTWTTFTATCVQATTPTQTLTYARYSRIGKTIMGNVYISFSAGTAGTAGTAITVTTSGLPAPVRQLNVCSYAFNKSGYGFNTGTVQLNTTPTFIFYQGTGGTYDSQLGATPSVSIGNSSSDHIEFSFTYEAAT